MADAPYTCILIKPIAGGLWGTDGNKKTYPDSHSALVDLLASNVTAELKQVVVMPPNDPKIRAVVAVILAPRK